MTVTQPERRQIIASQKDDLPLIYGSIDFEALPHRFTTDPAVPAQMRPDMEGERPRLLADGELVDLIATYTMLGDRVGDAYASLIPDYGFQRLVTMLVEACDHGVESVEGAPPELAAFLADMEQVPDWIDIDLVRRGAALERNLAAHVLPYVIRGALLGTFMNKYAALPMAIAGGLSESTAGKRANETAAFFLSSVLPGALDRDGIAFKSAAMVRLMHSMVRFNIMKRTSWDSSVYGVPIPQSDQMPAGFTGAFFLALQATRRGRSEFSADERARVEFARYRCFLLGLPQDLLPTEPQAIVDIMATRHATLRRDFDDDTCGRLVRATIAADIEKEKSPINSFRVRFERSTSKLFLVKSYLDGDEARAESMGVAVTPVDKLRAVGTLAFLATQVVPYAVAVRTPVLSSYADRRLVGKVERVLRRYSGAEFTTDGDAYRHHSA
ncbi:oxygenase MpaB family protein [Nocardioides caeni]|uniref:DUF2236 domain-containing protein n=1 Tax=Nocardioides caeni TaxID=574700 RepID=A0A4S8N0Z2_9ACTN|nr:oxygenase MpaB family protein [Nocardioides caeni]THV09450.1 DUF2236 domain-containing protein [Nocardioides caeni]